MPRHLRYALAVLLFAAVAPGGRAQLMSAGDVRFAAFGVGEGLSQSSVYALTRDARGFLWAGTHDGLNRFDGEAFAVFRHDPEDPGSLSHDRIHALLPEAGGGLWVVTSGGLDCLDARTGRFVRYGMPGGWELSALAPRRSGGLWVGTGRGLYAFDPQTGRSVLAAPDPLSVHAVAEASGAVWVGTTIGLRRLAEGTLVVPEGLPPGLDGARVRALLVDRQGGLWAGSEVGLFHRPTGAEAFTRVAVPHGVGALAEGVGGRIWAGGATGRGGLSVLDPATGHVTPLSPGGARALVQSLLPDASGVVWVGTDGGGVLRADPRPPKFARVPLGSEEASATFVRSVAEDAEGALWVGGTAGLRRRDPATGRWQTFRHRAGDDRSLPHDDARALLLDRAGTLWVGTAGGLAAYDGRGGFVRHALPIRYPEATSVTRLYETRDGTLWVATRGGVFRRRPDGAFELSRVHPAVPPALFTSDARALAEDRRGRLWIGTYGGDLFRFDPARAAVDAQAHVALGSTVMALAEDGQGRMWAGTPRGLVRLDPSAGAGPAPATGGRFDERDGLPSAFVYFLLEDEEGLFWAGTNRGLVRFDPAQERPAFRAYAPADGLQSNEFNASAAFRAPDGTLYAGGVAGLNAFTLASVRDGAAGPPVAFTGFKRFDEPADPGLDLNAAEALRLDWRRDAVFSLLFAGLDLADPARVRHAYRMEGVDPGWVDAGARREARYTNLAPGTYRFRVKAASADGAWGPERTLAVVIPPPFWRTGWFLALAGLAGLGAVGGGARYVAFRRLRRRLAALEAERATEHVLQAERARISADVHDHVGATLTRIQLLSDLARRSRNGRGEALVAQIAEATRDATQDLDAIVWAVNPAHDRLDAFADYLCAYAEQFCEVAGLACRFERPEAWPEGRLPAEVRHPAFAVLKEALTNVARHAGATTVQLRFLSTGGAVAVEVEDDGAGFDAATVDAFANGLKTMRARAEAAGGRLAVESAPGAGTRVRIALPLRAEAPAES